MGVLPFSCAILSAVFPSASTACRKRENQGDNGCWSKLDGRRSAQQKPRWGLATRRAYGWPRLSQIGLSPRHRCPVPSLPPPPAPPHSRVDGSARWLKLSTPPLSFETAPFKRSRTQGRFELKLAACRAVHFALCTVGGGLIGEGKGLFRRREI